MISEWCGTPNGYQIHRLNKEEACEACKSAAKLHARAYRFIKGMVHDLYRCKECGSVFTEAHTCHLLSDLDSAKT